MPGSPWCQSWDARIAAIPLSTPGYLDWPGKSIGPDGLILDVHLCRDPSHGKILAMNHHEEGLGPARVGAGRPKSLEKRAAIIDAAIEQFAAVGFDATSVDDVARRASVSKRTLYNYFESKEALFQVLVNQLGTRIEDFTAITYSPDIPLRTQLLKFAEQSRALNHEADTVRLLRAVVAEHIRRPERVEPLLRPFSSKGYGFRSWVAAAVQDGRLKGDPLRMSSLLGAIMRSMIFWPAVIQRVHDDVDIVQADLQEAVDMFLHYYATSDRERGRSSTPRISA